MHSKALSWFHSYLSERKQFVLVQYIDNRSTASLDFRVPQGSVLGLVLFILHTTPLSLNTEKHSVNHKMFADDTQLWKSVPSTDHDSLVLSLQKCTADVKNWILENKLKLNDEQTEAICFSPSSFGLAYSPSNSVSPGSSNINFTRKVRDLGFWLVCCSTTPVMIRLVCCNFFSLSLYGTLDRRQGGYVWSLFGSVSCACDDMSGPFFSFLFLMLLYSTLS